MVTVPSAVAAAVASPNAVLKKTPSSESVLISSMLTLMLSLAAEPTWKLVVPKFPSSSLRPPKVVVLLIRSSSFFN
ncbi:hypothetical protein D9M68_725040 [compost metagenome]